MTPDDATARALHASQLKWEYEDTKPGIGCLCSKLTDREGRLFDGVVCMRVEHSTNKPIPIFVLEVEDIEELQKISDFQKQEGHVYILVDKSSPKGVFDISVTDNYGRVFVDVFRVVHAYTVNRIPSIRLYMYGIPNFIGYSK